MKKIVFISILLLLFAIPTGFAENNNIEIHFTIGEDNLLINGNLIKVQKPFVKDGTTLVPLRVISEAFGAEVNWNGEEESITIELENTTIKLFINKNQAYVNEENINMLQAPIIIGDSSMVPLRFISENLGAQVTYNKDTEEIVVTKNIGTDNEHISDFSHYLNSNNKLIGDSFYKWSMNKIDNTDYYYRSFNGKESSFIAKDNSFQLDFIISDLLENTTIDSIYNTLINDAKGYTIINKEKKITDQYDYAKIIFRDKDYTYEEIVFIRDNLVFSLFLYADNSAYDQNLLNTFRPEYNDSTDINDLSEINNIGLRPYKNKELKWNIDLFPEWEIVDNSYNKVMFSNNKEFINNFNQDLIVIKITSRENNLSLEEWKNKLVDIYENNYNHDTIKLIDCKNKTINNKDSYELISKTMSDNKKSYSKEYIFIDKEYKYYICFSLTENSYFNKEFQTNVQKIIESFSITTLDKNEIGEIIDYHLLTYNEKTNYRKISSSDYDYSINIPELWEEVKQSDKTYKYFYQQDNLFNLSINVIENKKLNEIINQYDEEFINTLDEDNLLLEKKIEKINSKGTIVYKYSIKVNLIDRNINSKIYFLQKNNNIYVLTFSYNELLDSKGTRNKINEMWNSFSVEVRE